MNECPKVIIIMGVSGCGKTTIGHALANSLGWQFKDADDYHSLSNKEKMNKGIPLTDFDRTPWLKYIRKQIESWIIEDKATILACSSLKNSYRQILSSNLPMVKFAYLKLDKETLLTRLDSRQHEFMNPELLESQFIALEEPVDALTVDASNSIDELVKAIEQRYVKPQTS